MDRVPIITTRDHIAHDLWSYGEDELVDVVRSPAKVIDFTLMRIWLVAGKYAMDDEYALSSGYGMALHKAVALAAVEVLEGQPRELARQRRRARS